MKIYAWLLISLGIFTEGLWKHVSLFSLSRLQAQGIYPWAILFLCSTWIYLKRGDLRSKMKADPPKSIFVFAGLIIIALSFAARNYFNSLPFLVFTLLLSSLGFFFIFFGEAAVMPSMLLGVYGFSIAFPATISRFFDPSYSLATAKVVTEVLNALGYQMNANGQVISFLDSSGQGISVFINAACSGSASLTLFIAIFILMMLDIRLPVNTALSMFFFGLAGTSVQNIIRLIILLLAGYYYGSGALWTAHLYAGYIIFPVWFAFFVLIYLRAYKKKKQVGEIEA